MDRISLQRNARDFSQHYAAHTQRKRRMQGEEARYTLVLHSARKTLHITINEYCLADTIHKLSGSRSPVPGWCYASKEHLGKSLGFSRQSIHAMINKLKKKQLVEVDSATGHLRSTDLWRDTVEILKTKVFGD
jgi:hypothetical protein